MVNFLQINLNGNWSAEQLMFQTADETKTDILVVSEPFAKCGREDSWCFSTDRKAAVALTQWSSLFRNRHGAGEGFAWATFGDLSVFSCYWRPGTTLQEFASFLADLEVAIHANDSPKVVVAGDFNAWNTEWGSRTNNPRGRLLSDLAASLGLLLANDGSVPTFVRGTATSVIDVTFYRGLILSDWRVLEADSLSDHAYVCFRSPAEQQPPPHDESAASHRGWSKRNRDDEALAQYFRSTRPETGEGPIGVTKALASAAGLDDFLRGACEASMPRQRPGPPGKRPVYWWSEGLAELRRKCLALRRVYQNQLRRAGQHGAQEARFGFCNARKDLRSAIREAKKKCWSDLCNQVEDDPWGKPYKLVRGKLGPRNQGADSRGREAEIADFLFPAAPPTNWDEAPSAAVTDLFEAFDPEVNALVFTRVIPLFTEDELCRAAKRLSSGKSPGPSGIPNEVLKRYVKANTRAVLKVYNDCLQALTFPPCWKKARLVLIRKGADKPPDAPSSYRPICMLDTPGKLLERLLLQRLEGHLDAHGGRRRAANQYGFRKGVSTESAVERVLSIAANAASKARNKDLCVLVTLDVKNAFNSLRWPVIDEALRKKKVPEYLVEMFRSWLTDRKLLTGEDMNPRPVTCGVPQGSVLGPALWNVAYDSLLEMNVPSGVHLVGFADDLAVVGVASTGQLLEDAVNPVLRAIDLWMRSKGLELAHHKTEAVILSRRRAFVPPRLEVGGHAIEMVKDLRYLGVRLDSKMSFNEHIAFVAKKATVSATALARLMPNISGPGQWKRRLLASVVESQLLYAAPVWSSTVSASRKATRGLIRPQRAVALRVIRAYRTVSDEVALLLAQMPPADLLAQERARLKKRREQPAPPEGPVMSLDGMKFAERQTTLELWQRRWAFSTKGQWTRRLIPNVKRWVCRALPQIPLTFRMTQALSGHGCFQHYLNRMGRAVNPVCLQCGYAVDTAEHTLLACPHWEPFRAELVDRLGHRLSVEALSRIICGPAEEDLPPDPETRGSAIDEAVESLRLLYRMVEGLLSAKEDEERARQAAEEVGQNAGPGRRA